MNEDVHFYSRPVALRRLCYYFILMIVGVVTILLIRGGTGGDPGVSEIVVAANFPAGHQILPFEQVSEDKETLVALRPEPIAPVKPVVKVKLRYHAFIQQAGLRHGVELAMIRAIIMAESSYNPRAVSSRGASGLMQLMPITADSMGVEDRFDPKHNIDGGVRYFKRLLVRFEGDTRLALAAYNAGAKKVRQYNGIPPYKATRSYIEKVFKYYRRYKDLEKGTAKSIGAV